MTKIVEITESVKCDFCDKEAKYDARTIAGPWANLCENCFKLLGMGLGTGKGQKYKLVK